MWTVNLKKEIPQNLHILKTTSMNLKSSKINSVKVGKIIFG